MSQLNNSDEENNSPKNVNSSAQRKLCYRSLLNKIEILEEANEFNLETVQNVHSVINDTLKIDQQCPIKEKLRYADEILLDATVLSSASNLLLKCTNTVDSFINSYNAKDFCKKIIKAIDPEYTDDNPIEADNFFKLIKYANNIIPTLPEYSYLYGAYDLNNLPKPKERKERQKRVQQEEAQKKKPEKIVNAEKEEENIDKITDFLYKVLCREYQKNGNNPIKYYDYVIDTEDFSITVENMFYFAFLIRDGKAHLTIDGHGVPYIKPQKKEDLDKFREENGINVQIASKITMTEWNNFKTPGFIQKARKRGKV